MTPRSHARYAVLPHDLVLDPDLPVTAKAVALAVALYGNFEDGWTFTSMPTLAKALQISVPTVKRSLSALEEQGWIERRRVRSTDGTMGRGEYRLAFDHGSKTRDHGSNTHTGSDLQEQDVSAGGNHGSHHGSNPHDLSLLLPNLLPKEELGAKRPVVAFVDSYRASHQGADPIDPEMFGAWAKKALAAGKSLEVVLKVAERAGAEGRTSKPWLAGILSDIESGRQRIARRGPVTPEQRIADTHRELERLRAEGKL